MSRFSSPVEVVWLFLLATVVSMGLIFLIKAETLEEQRKQNNNSDKMEYIGKLRIGDDDGGEVNNGTGLLGYVRRRVLTFFGGVTKFGGRRKKRSVFTDSGGGRSEETMVIRMRHSHQQPHQHPPHHNNNEPEEVVVGVKDSVMCYETDDVLVIVGLTSCLHFAFVLFVWGIVRWFSRGGDDGSGGSNKFPRGRGECSRNGVMAFVDDDGWNEEDEESEEEELIWMKRRSQSMEDLRYVT